MKRPTPDLWAKIESTVREEISTAREGSEVVMSMRMPPGQSPKSAPMVGSRRTERTSDLGCGYFGFVGFIMSKCFLSLRGCG
ncbi:hypothetical protein ACFX1X_007813 [Malus domestica]